MNVRDGNCCFIKIIASTNVVTEAFCHHMKSEKVYLHFIRFTTQKSNLNQVRCERAPIKIVRKIRWCSCLASCKSKEKMDNTMDNKFWIEIFALFLKVFENLLWGRICPFAIAHNPIYHLDQHSGNFICHQGYGKVSEQELRTDVFNYSCSSFPPSRERCFINRSTHSIRSEMRLNRYKHITYINTLHLHPCLCASSCPQPAIEHDRVPSTTASQSTSIEHNSISFLIICCSKKYEKWKTLRHVN